MTTPFTSREDFEQWLELFKIALDGTAGPGSALVVVESADAIAQAAMTRIRARVPKG